MVEKLWARTRKLSMGHFCQRGAYLREAEDGSVCVFNWMKDKC